MKVTKIVDLLNELLALDRQALTDLISSRVSCNDKLALHKTVQVFQPPQEDITKVGLLGILSGIAGLDGYTIFSIVDERNPQNIRCFGFEKNKEKGI